MTLYVWVGSDLFLVSRNFLFWSFLYRFHIKVQTPRTSDVYKATALHISFESIGRHFAPGGKRVGDVLSFLCIYYPGWLDSYAIKLTSMEKNLIILHSTYNTTTFFVWNIHRTRPFFIISYNG